MNIFLTPTQQTILAHAIGHTEGRIEWFPDNINGGARQKVLDGLAKRELIRQVGKKWLVAAEGYDTLGVPRSGVRKRRIGKFEAKFDQIIANAEGAPCVSNDTELEAAVAAAEATWAKPRTRANSKQIVWRDLGWQKLATDLLPGAIGAELQELEVEQL